jgi:hypothetical protein
MAPLRRTPVPLLLALLAAASAAPPAAGQDTAAYAVRFEAEWNAVDQPADFPADAHFSPLVGATHGPNVELWRPGGAASEGIRLMAEQGQVVPLRSEVRAVGDAADFVVGEPANTSPGVARASLTVSQAHPLVTLVTMVAPSPDWFVGVAGLPLAERGEWLLRKEVALGPWDAGTDSGTTFTSPNQPTSPRQPIHPITGFPFAGTPPLGRFVFERTDAPPPEPLVLGAGRFEVTAVWTTPGGSSAYGKPVPLTADTGWFWFFRDTNVEVVVKVLDACAISGRYWVFAGGLTDVGVELVVRDTEAGVETRYETAPGEPFPPIQDTAALATCS